MEAEKLNDAKKENHSYYQFKLERYRYILDQKKNLNLNVFRYLTVFQTISSSLVAGAIFILINYGDQKINIAITKLSIRGIYGLILVLTVFVIISILAGVYSWADYRKEEEEIWSEFSADTRPYINDEAIFKNFWRWYETYIILFILITAIAIYVFFEAYLLKLI